MPVDPFTQVYAAIVEALTGFDDWKALVIATKLVRFDQSNNPFPPQATLMRSNLQAADTPQVRLLQGPFRIDMGLNSCAVGITQSYALQVQIGNLVVSALNAIKWQTIRALFAYDQSMQLNLPGIVRRVLVGRSVDEMVNRDGAAWSRDNAHHWETLITLGVEMAVDKAALGSGSI